MAIHKITIEEFLQQRERVPFFDVRSPGEYSHAHIPNAQSLPLFSDDERKVVGTAYKQQSREDAIKIGLDYFGVKMRKMVEEVEQHLKNSKDKRVIVHCWRGGMRSAGVAWLLDLYGFNVSTLVGGYKAYRKWIHQQFEKQHSYIVMGGYTGSGKTLVLHSLKESGSQVIDLEDLANHRGSSFGTIEGKPQPTQEMFENLLGEELANIKDANADNPVWLEDESRRIGDLNLPLSFWQSIRNAPVCFLNIPFEHRLQHIIDEYGAENKEHLINATLRIQKRLGGLETKNAVQYLDDNNIKAAFEILLKYYDKHYKKALDKRGEPDVAIQQIDCDGVNAKTNSEKLLAWKSKNQ